MARFIDRVTVVDVSGGTGTATTLVKGKKKGKKKVTSWLRPTERVLRRAIKGERRCWTDLARRHDKSRGKKRDRWLTDSVSNTLRSMDKGCRVWSKL